MSTSLMEHTERAERKRVADPRVGRGDVVEIRGEKRLITNVVTVPGGALVLTQPPSASLADPPLPRVVD